MKNLQQRRRGREPDYFDAYNAGLLSWWDASRRLRGVVIRERMMDELRLATIRPEAWPFKRRVPR